MISVPLTAAIYAAFLFFGIELSAWAAGAILIGVKIAIGLGLFGFITKIFKKKAATEDVTVSAPPPSA